MSWDVPPCLKLICIVTIDGLAASDILNSEHSPLSTAHLRSVFAISLKNTERKSLSQLFAIYLFTGFPGFRLIVSTMCPNSKHRNCFTIVLQSFTLEIIQLQLFFLFELNLGGTRIPCWHFTPTRICRAQFGYFKFLTTTRP